MAKHRDDRITMYKIIDGYTVRMIYCTTYVAVSILDSFGNVKAWADCTSAITACKLYRSVGRYTVANTRDVCDMFHAVMKAK